MTILITIIFLILLNGFFSLSEMAIVSCSRPVIKDMARRGNKRASYVLKLLDHEGKFLSAIQVGITAIGTLAGAYGGANVAKGFGEFLDFFTFFNPHGETIALTIVVAGLTYVSVVIGELIPKRVALRRPETIALYVARPMLIISFIFSPVVKLLDTSAEMIMKFLGIFSVKDNKVTEEELKAMINEGMESGAIEESEHEMMQRIFKLDNREAKSIMTHVGDVTFMYIDDSIDEIRRKVNEAGHSRYPVMDQAGKKILGVVQSKELLGEALFCKEIRIKDHLREVHFISENTSCLKVLEMFKSSSIHLAVVVDENNEAQGIVSAPDIFEAVVGLISTNYDEKDEAIKEREDGSWLVDGLAAIDEVHIIIGIEAIDSSYDTVADFCVDNLPKPVKLGAKFVKYNYSFEIVDMDGAKIDKVLITEIK